MTQEEKAYAAGVLLDTPLVVKLLDQIEANAVDSCVLADPKDHEARAAYAAEVRAIRDLRSRLEMMRASTAKRNIAQ